jgi:hypothetical protein
MPRRPCPPPDGPFAVPVAGDLVMETGLVTASSTDGHPERDRNLTDVPQHVRQRFFAKSGTSPLTPPAAPIQGPTHLRVHADPRQFGRGEQAGSSARPA